MAGITLADAEAQLAVWLAASTAVASKQSYTIEGRAWTGADAAEIRRSIDYWEGKVQTLSAATRRGRSIVPRPLF